jgi:transcriptional regulator with XRE-family HTH domain
MPVRLPDEIKQARLRAGLSQRDLALRLGVAPSAVSQWESGTTMPTIANRADIGAILGIRFASMLPEVSHSGNDPALADPTVAAIVTFWLT